MKKEIQKGDYVKAYGGNFGLYFDGKKWISFECDGCACAKGLINKSRRLSTADHPQLRKRIGYNFTERHDKEIHNRWYQEGRPTK